MSRDLFHKLTKLRKYKRRIKRSYKQLQTAYNEQSRLFLTHLSGELKEAVSYAREAAQTRRRKLALEAGLRHILSIKDTDTIHKRVCELLNNDFDPDVKLVDKTNQRIDKVQECQIATDISAAA